MTDTSHAVYVIGSTKTVFPRSVNAKFYFDQSANQDTWKTLPNLKQARNSHGSIQIGKNTIIVGGQTQSDHSTIEIWDFETGEAVTIDLSPGIPDSPKTKFYMGIALFPVYADFCKK